MLKTAIRTCARLLLCIVLVVSMMPMAPYSAYADIRPGSGAAPLADSGLWDGSIDTSWYVETADEFTLSTPSELAGLAAIVNGTAAGIAKSDFSGKTVMLGADMLLNPYAATGADASQRNWIPIGSRPATGTHTGSSGVQPVFDSPNYFKGVFDGQGHVIRNLYINNVAYPDQNYPSVSDYGGYQGLFGALGDGAVVKNVGVHGGYVTGRVAGGIAALGAPASASRAPMILNCYNTATIEGDGSSSRGSGGIFGGEYGSEGDNGLCYLANCYNMGPVSGKGRNAGASLGGIAGCGIVSVFSCYNTGTVAASVSGLRGGVVGSLVAGGMVADSFSLASASDALYCDPNGSMTADSLIEWDAVLSLVADGLLSAAFIGDGVSEPTLFWESGASAQDISQKASIADVPTQVYTGMAVTPELSVSYGGTLLKTGSDYLVEYADNVNATRAGSLATYTVTFIGAYTGTVSGTFEIGTSTLDTATIGGLGPHWVYGNEPVQPQLTVKDASGRVLALNKDYVASYTDNDHPGVATVVITPAQGSSYVGSKTEQFKLVAASTKLQGAGTEDNPFLISNRADMQFLAHAVNTLPVNEQESNDTLSGVFRLTADVELAGTEDQPAVDPIGSSTWSDEEGYRTKAFAGTLDGDSHAIVYDFNVTGGYFGLFPTNAENTTVVVRNLNLAGSVKTTATAATLFPNVYGSMRLENVKSQVDISAGYKAYGLIGGIWPRNNSVSLESCRNDGAISAANEASGLVGELNANSTSGCTFDMLDCVNGGTVTAGAGGTAKNSNRASGLLAKLTQFQTSTEIVHIEGCANTGAVSADGTAGGLVASMGSSDSAALSSSGSHRQVVTASYNTGAVTAGTIAGGLVGAVFDGNELALSNAYNTGAVKALGETGTAGGLVGGSQTGRAWVVDVSGAYNAGKISGSEGQAGAVMGFAGCGSYLKPAGGELRCSQVFYLENSAPAPVGTLQEEQVLPYFTYPAAQLVSNPSAKTVEEMKTTGAQGFAGVLGTQFSDDLLSQNDGFPVLYWQAGAFTPEDISDANVGAIADIEYTGAAVVPTLDVTLGGKKLRQGSDFTVEIVGDAISVRTGVEVVLKGIGRYSGSISGLTFNIVKADISRFSIDEVGAQWASQNDPAEPAVTLRDKSGAAIHLSSGFTVVYANNWGESEQGSVTVAARVDNENYTGEVSAQFSVNALPADLKGEGTQADPYRISTYQELELFAKRVNAQKAGYPESHAQITADIAIPAGVQLDPVGNGTSEYTSGTPFSGTFDGAGHTITLDYHTPTTYALFNGLQDATVKNLVVDGFTTVTSAQTGARTTIGGTFAGVLDASVTFENCVNKATVVGSSRGVGGFAAMTDDEGIPAVNYRAGTAQILFKNCVNEGAVSGVAEDGGVDYVGGFVGYAYTKGFGGAIDLVFENCSNCGAVATESGLSAGGIVGGATYDYDTDSEDSFKMTMRCVANEGPVSAYDGAGGLVGVMTNVDKVDVRDVYNTGSVTIASPDALTGELAGGLFAIASSSNYRSSPQFSLRNAYNAGLVTCSASGEGVDPLIGGILGGLSYDEKYVTFDNVYYSLDKTDTAIGLDRGSGSWEEVVNPEFDDTMRDPLFALELGDSFQAANHENDGFPVLASARIDLSGYSVTFRDAKNRLGVEGLEVPYTGLPATPALVVRPVNSLASLELTLGTDYVVFFRDNVNTGTATATVRGIGAYRGTVERTFSIVGSGSLDSCVVGPIPDQVWTGSPLEPELTVSVRSGGASMALKQGKDFTVSYTANVNEGTAAALVEGIGAWSGSKMVTFRIWKPFITVQVRKGNGALKVAKRYTKAEFEALAVQGNPVSALYYSDGSPATWRVSTARSYVTFDRLLADAGVPWKLGVTVSYAAADDASKESAFTYADLNSRFFYPATDADSVRFDGACATPPVLALEEYSSAVGANGASTAGQAELYNLDNANDGNAPRVITGITEQEAREKTARGARLIKNLDTIVVTVVDFGQLNSAIAEAEAVAKEPALSPDGKDIAQTAKWVTPAAKRALENACAAAKQVSGNPNATQAQVNAALAELTTARAGFKPQAGLRSDSQDKSSEDTKKDDSPGSDVNTNLSSCVTVSCIASKVYTGKAIKPLPVVKAGVKKLKRGVDYTLSYKNNKNVGTAKITVKGKGTYSGTTHVAFKITKAKNTMAVKTLTPSVKYSKKAKRVVTAKKAFKVSKAKGKVTYKKTGGNKKVVVAKNGKVTVKKGLKPGKYTVKVRVKAAGTKAYKSAVKTVKLTLTVKKAR